MIHAGFSMNRLTATISSMIFNSNLLMRRIILCAIFVVIYSHQVSALEFERVPVINGVVVNLAGTINHGDADRFNVFVDQLRRTDRILAIGLDSEGGFVLEGISLASEIAASNIPVYVAPHKKCWSACFLLFAAARNKLVFTGASIGIHSAGLDGVETDGSVIVTMIMAKFLENCHVPAKIIGRMLLAGNNQVAWLSADELTSMGARIISVPIFGKN